MVESNDCDRVNVAAVVNDEGMDLWEPEISDDLLRDVQAAWDGKVLRLKYPYVFDLIRVLAPYKKLRRTIALDAMWRARKNAGLVIPPSFDSSVQAALQYYCPESNVFKKRGAQPSEALFRWPDGAGAGVWAVIRETAEPWVKANRQTLPRRILS
jgi:hypothetical protein